VQITHVATRLTHAAAVTLTSLDEWIKTSFTEQIPCCIAVDDNEKNTKAVFFTGLKKYSNIRQCLQKLRLGTDLAVGSVVLVDGNKFIQSYSLLLAFKANTSLRCYEFASSCSIPSKMYYIPETLYDYYNLLRSVQTLRERITEEAIRTLVLSVVHDTSGSSTQKFGISGRGRGLEPKTRMT
jgi:hypothetical protein